MKSRLILVADRSDIARRIVREILMRQGFRVLEAGTKEAALRVVARFGSRLDVVIAESTPAAGTGFDLALEIGRVAPHIPLLAMFQPTPYVLRPAPEESFGSQRPTVKKPFTQALLLERLEPLLARPIRYKTATMAS